jgi:MoaA/NifB/PqqE/SkfB family radical SAM enzyme
LLAALARADLAAGSFASAAALLRRALAREANILHLQALYRRATGAEEPSEAASRFCSAPFESLETAPGGDAYFCCPAWLPVPIGNLNADGAAEVWNSPAAQEIRASILDGSYRYCSRVHCPKLSGHALPHRSEVTAGRLRRVIESEATRLDHGPKRIVLSHDRSCNLSCPSCRTGLILARKAEQASLNRMADAVLFPLLSNADCLRVTSGGDPFGSAHFQYVLRHLDRASNPDLRLELQTNGILLTPRLWGRLKLEGRVDQLIVSVDAAEADTYAVVRRGGRFEILLGNLAFMSALRHERRIRRLRFDFVVQAKNFREMPAFVDFARSFAADSVKFQMVRSWGTWTPQEFARQDIGDPAHPEYADFLAVLRDPRLAPPYSELWGMAAAVRAAVRERPAEAT